MHHKFSGCLSRVYLVLVLSAFLAPSSRAEDDLSFRWWHASRELSIYDGYGSAAFYGLQYTHFIENTPRAVFVIGNWGTWEWEPDKSTEYERVDVQTGFMHGFGSGFSAGAGLHLFTEDANGQDWYETLAHMGPELLVGYSSPIPPMEAFGIRLSGACMPIFWFSENKWANNVNVYQDEGVTWGYTLDGALTYKHEETGLHFNAGYRFMRKESCTSSEDVEFKGSSFEGPYAMAGVMW